MKRLLIIFALLFCAPAMWGVAYTASASGDCNANATWGGGGHPTTSADTATIGTPRTVTCTGAFTVGTMTITTGGTFDGGANNITIGTSGATGTAAVTVNANGTFKTSYGGALNLYGDLQYQVGSTVNLGSDVTTHPPASGTYYAITMLNAGSGTASVTIGNASPAQRITVTSDQTNTPTTGIVNRITVGAAAAATYTIQNSTWTWCGSASVHCFDQGSGSKTITWNLSNNCFGCVGGSALTKNIGALYINAFYTGTWSNNDFRNWLDATGPLNIQEAASYVAPRLFSGFTFYWEPVAGSTTVPVSKVAVNGMQCGFDTAYGDATTVPCAYTPDVGLSTYFVGVSNVVVRGLLGALDTSSATPYLFTALGTSKIQDLVLISSGQNAHQIGESGSTGPGANTYQNIFCDGVGVRWTDSGNLINTANPTNVLNVWGVNSCGQIVTPNGSANTQYTMHNVTNFQNNAIAVPATSSTTAFTSLRNNMIVNPFLNIPGAMNDVGLSSQGLAFATQSVVGWNDYMNFFYMPDSNDVDPTLGGTAPACPGNGAGIYCAIPHPALGNIPGYVTTSSGAGNPVISGTSTVASSATAIVCSGCTFTSAMVGDFFCDARVGGYVHRCAQIQTYTSATQVTLLSPGVATFNGAAIAFVVNTGWWANNGLFGITANEGTHDMHINPNFRNPYARMAKWYYQKTGTQIYDYDASSATQNTNNVWTATGGTTTTITCSTCPTVYAGDIFVDYDPTGPVVRGVGVVSSSGGGTINYVNDNGSFTPLNNDIFILTSAASLLGRSVVQLNGWDRYGNAVTPPAWVNNNTIWDILNYSQWSFTPMNGAMMNAGEPASCDQSKGYNTCTPGASFGHPAAINGSN